MDDAADQCRASHPTRKRSSNTHWIDNKKKAVVLRAVGPWDVFLTGRWKEQRLWTPSSASFNVASNLVNTCQSVGYLEVNK